MARRQPLESFTFIGITRPGGSGPTPVRVVTGIGGGSGTGMTPTGFICAEGTAEMQMGENPIQVVARIYPPDATVPLDPPLDVVVGFLDPARRVWHFDRLRQSVDIPGAACGPNTAAARTNRLVVWAIYPTAPAASDTILFQGVCSNDTECGGGGIPEIASLSAVPLNAPRRMQVDAVGFSGKALPLQGSWTLALTHGMHCVWSNAGDGVKTPQVELRLDLNDPHQWRLTLRLGKIELLYVQTQKNWGWSRANELVLQGDSGTTGVPSSLKVRPI